MSKQELQGIMNLNNNPLLCNIETSICKMPAESLGSGEFDVTTLGKPIRIVYYTDPICSACWGIEPQLRRLKLEYGHVIHFDYRMGGLLPDWSYNSGGISQPADVARHWDDVSKHYDMPIDGDVWLEDPLHSSYPPSIAFKAAQMQNEFKAMIFLRKLREMVFLKKKNITKWEHMETSARDSDLDLVQFKADFNAKGKHLFQDDLSLAQTLGVTGFPTLFLFDQHKNREVVYGVQPYSVYENAILMLNPEVDRKSYINSWQALFTIYPTMTVKEFAVISGRGREEAHALLENLVADQKLRQMETKNGALFISNKD